MALPLLAANLFMLYSRAPHDILAMVAHLGKVCGYLMLLLSLMQMASVDMFERIRAERELAKLNQELEGRVLDRTARLEAANQSLEAEIGERKQVESSLRESQERTGAIIDSALDGVIVMNHEGRIVEFNPAAEQIFGYSPDEVIGRILGEVIILAKLREGHQRGLANYLATGVGPVLGKRIEITGLRADGSEVPLELSITRMPESGSPLFTGFLRDITDRKLAERRVQAQLTRLELLHHITRAIGERQDLRSIFQVVIRSLEYHLLVDFSCVCLYERSSENLTVTSVGVRSSELAMELAMTEQA